MFSYFTKKEGILATSITFLWQKRLYLLILTSAFFVYQGLHYLYFVRAIWSSIDVMMDNRSYAPHFDLQKVSNGKWSLEKKKQIEDIWYHGTQEEKESIHQRAQEALRAENSNIKPDFSKYPEPILHQLPHSDFSLRREQVGAGELLLKCNYTNTIFAYDPATRQMTLSSEEKWNNSIGEIVEGGNNLNFGSIKYDKNGNSNCGVNYECLSKSISAYGNVGWGRVFSPDYSRIAVLSIDGPASGGGGFMIETPMIRGGVRYLEMFEIGLSKSSDKPEFKKIGKTIRIYDPNESKKISLDWLPDNQFIIAFTEDNSVVSIIDINDFKE